MYENPLFSKQTQSRFSELLYDSEDRLIEKVLTYAKCHNYAKYTSTLEEAWRISVRGLTEALVGALAQYDCIPELDPDDTGAEDPCSQFGVIEAQYHRSRGVTLAMFLGMMKYYRQGYIDLIEESALSDEEQQWCRMFATRFFDRMEIGFCTEWIGSDEKNEIARLQNKNRELTNEKNRFLTIFESLHPPVIMFDRNGEIENLNSSAATLFGITLSSESIYYKRQDLKTDIPWISEKVKDFIASGDKYLSFDKSYEKDGRFSFYTILLKKMVDVSGKYDGITATVLDLTERKKMEDVLRSERDKFQRYLDIAGVILIAIDKDHTVSLINKKGCEVLGFSEDEIIGTNWFENYVLPSEVEAVKHVFNTLMHEDLDSVEYYENTILTKQHEEKMIAWHNLIRKDNDGAIIGILSSGEDITERKKKDKEKKVLEEQLHQSQKMETIGRLAGGIAHDFNNLLTVINGNAELLLMSLPTTHEMYKDINEIKNTAERAANLTRQLLAFSRKQIVKPQIIDLNYLLVNMEKMVLRLIGEDIEFKLDLGNDVYAVKIDPSQFEQVITNLVVNARDAMPHGGSIVIETKNVTVTETMMMTYSIMSPGQYVCVTLNDTGTGMDDEVLTKIFEPFFTTKERGKGTGLGLSTCYGIIKQNDGYIHVQSQPGSGTAFKIYLPGMKNKSSGAEDRDKTVDMASGTETILLVEDELALRTMMKKVLARQGYTMFEAGNGAEALKLIEEGTVDSFDLLLTDVIMPQMGGLELAEKLAEKYPGLKIIFVSGYAENAILKQGVLDPGFTLIEKPFSPSDLVNRIRRKLDEPV